MANYIGETEKNLGRVSAKDAHDRYASLELSDIRGPRVKRIVIASLLTAAIVLATILYFEEADSLFGKRSE